jgi:hypothetical protein
MNVRTGLLIATALVAALSSGAVAVPASDPVILWNANAGAAATKACIAPDGDPFHESRMYAMMHIAIYDAMNAIERRFQPHTYDKKAEPGTSPDAAVAAAAHDVLVPLIKQLPPELLAKKECIDDGVASAETSYTAALAALPESQSKTRGIALGQAAAAAILEARAADHGNDGPFLNKNCPQPQPGKYQCTPGYPFIVFETWEKVTPFVLKDSAQFRPGPPYAVTNKAFKADLDDVKSLGGDGKTTPSARTPDQTQIALFWWESSPLKRSRIARTVATDKGLKPWDNARLFAILNMALADGYIAMVSAKNHYDFWRPVTAIQSGGDPIWTPLLPTPPDQDYPSGHSIEGGAGAEVLKQFFGTDQIRFQDCGVALPAGSTCDDAKPVLRSFASFTQAANENGLSRVLVGFHFRNATAEGTAYGRKIGERAATLLQSAK